MSLVACYNWLLCVIAVAGVLVICCLWLGFEFDYGGDCFGMCYGLCFGFVGLVVLLLVCFVIYNGIGFRWALGCCLCFAVDLGCCVLGLLILVAICGLGRSVGLWFCCVGGFFLVAILVLIVL